MLLRPLPVCLALIGCLAVYVPAAERSSPKDRRCFTDNVLHSKEHAPSRHEAHGILDVYGNESRHGFVTAGSDHATASMEIPDHFYADPIADTVGLFDDGGRGDSSRNVNDQVRRTRGRSGINSLLASVAKVSESGIVNSTVTESNGSSLHRTGCLHCEGRLPCPCAVKSSSALSTDAAPRTEEGSWRHRAYIIVGAFFSLCMLVALVTRQVWHSRSGLPMPSTCPAGFTEVAVLGLLPKMGWAVSECLIIPHLARLGVPQWLCATGWVISTFVSLPLQPILGSLSDSYGRGVVGGSCALLSAAGNMIMGKAGALAAGGESWVLVIIILSFAVVDVSHDTFFSIMRASFADVFQDDTILATTMADIFLSAGAAIAYLIVLFPWNGMFRCSREEGSFIAAGCLMAGGAVFLLVRTWHGHSLGTLYSLEVEENKQEQGNAKERETVAEKLTPGQVLEQASVEQASEEAGSGLSYGCLSVVSALPRSAVHVLLLGLTGWWANLTFEFYATAVVEEQGKRVMNILHGVDGFDIVASALFVQATLSILLNLKTRSLYSWFDQKAARVLLLGASLYAFRLTIMIGGNAWLWCLGTILQCLSNLITENFPFLWLEHEFASTGAESKALVRKRRGFLTGMLNDMVPLGTFLSGISGGLAVSGSFTGTLLLPALLNFLVFLAVALDVWWCSSTRCRD